MYSHSRFTRLTFLLGKILHWSVCEQMSPTFADAQWAVARASSFLQHARSLFYKLAKNTLRQVAASRLSKMMRVKLPRLLQTSRHERAEAEQKLNKLTADNDQLVQRLVEMKATEVERMNEVNRTCDEMVSHPPVYLLHSSCLKDIAVLAQTAPACCAKLHHLCALYNRLCLRCAAQFTNLRAHSWLQATQKSKHASLLLCLNGFCSNIS